MALYLAKYPGVILIKKGTVSDRNAQITLKTCVEKNIYLHIDCNESPDTIATKRYLWFSQNNDSGEGGGEGNSAANYNSG